MNDIRYGYRTLVKNPGFTAVAVLSLALGIGANTAIFSFIDTIMLRTLPVRDPGELVVMDWRASREPDVYRIMTHGDCNGLGARFGRECAPPGAAGCSFSLPFFRALA